MADHKLNVDDVSTTADATVSPIAPPELKAYEVIAENGVFKEGKTIKAGQQVELDEQTARSAIEAGDVKEIK